MSLIYRICVIFLVLTVASCATGPRAPKQAKSVDAKPETTLPLAMEKATFAAESVISKKVIAECSVLEQLTTSTRNGMADRSIALEYLNEGASAADKDLLVVTYDKIVPQAWRFTSVKPYSSATYTAKIVRGDKVLSEYTRAISSGVAFATCARLEKISLAVGKSIAHWVSTKGY